MSKSVFVLRACNSDMSSYNNFKWPTSGPVECQDWKPIAYCGNGLHGWLHGHGNGGTSNYWGDKCNWLVVKVKTKHLIDLSDKVKFKKGEVVFCGDRKGATAYILKHDPIAITQPVVGAIVETGDKGTATSGYQGISTSGSGGTSVCGDHGTATSGFNGLSRSGYRGTAISGARGISISLVHGCVQSGENGTIIIKYNDDNYNQKTKVGHIGVGKLLPDVLYRLNGNYQFVKA